MAPRMSAQCRILDFGDHLAVLAKADFHLAAEISRRRRDMRRHNVMDRNRIQHLLALGGFQPFLLVDVEKRHGQPPDRQHTRAG